MFRLTYTVMHGSTKLIVKMNLNFFSCSPRQIVGRPTHIQDARIDENGRSSCDRHVCPIVTKENTAEEFLVKPVNMKIHEVPIRGSRCVCTDGRTDGTNLIGTPPGSKCLEQ